MSTNLRAMLSHATWSSILSGIAGPSSSYQGGGNSRIPATAGTISARMIRIQRMTAVCGGIVLISVVALRSGDSGVTSSRFSGTPLPRLEDLDGLDIRFRAPAARLAFGHPTAFLPFGVAARRNALGPELARRVRGEVDHDAV